MSEPIEATDDQLRWLELDAAITFDLDATGRICSENDPNRSPGPRLFLAGGRGGNLVRLRHDVGEGIAARIRALVETSPPWCDPRALPSGLPQIAALLAQEAPVEVGSPAVIHRLPPGLERDPSVRIVRGDSRAGARLLSRLARDGAPPALAQAGFTGVEDFWAPWCAALEGDEIAAMAFAARTGAPGASIGVYTFPGFRGRGLAAAVTADWSRSPRLAGRFLVYSALWANASSLRVIDRLALPHIGVSLRIT